jgi:hypothetical protein
MLKKAYAESAMMTDGGWVSLDAADLNVIDSVYKKSLREGEERLMHAVLENAVEYFQKYVLARNPRGKKLFQEAEEWFLDKETEALYSFENICETLGFHPDYIRKGLMVWKEAKLKLGSPDNDPGRSKLARSRVKHPSIRLPKTA